MQFFNTIICLLHQLYLFFLFKIIAPARFMQGMTSYIYLLAVI